MTFSIEIIDLLGDSVATVAEAWTVAVDEYIDGTEILTFDCLTADADLIVTDYTLELTEDDVLTGRYQVTGVESFRDDSTLHTVTAEGDYLRLADRLPDFGVHSFVGNPQAGLADLVDDWGGVPDWDVGTAPTSPAAVEINEVDKSFLSLIQIWAKLCSLDLEFDTVAHEVSLLDPETRGTTHGTLIAYADNLLSIRRTREPLIASRYRLYGRDGVDIGNVEDFSWYLGLGLDETQALGHRRTLVERDDSILNTTQLTAITEQRIAQLSQPRYTYECDVVDLGLEALRVGDRVGVSDAPLGVDITTTVVRRKRVLDDPAESVVELSYLRPDLGTEPGSGLFDGGAGLGGVRPASIVIAPVDSRDPASADFHLTGEGDAAVIQGALDTVISMPRGGSVLILDGQVHLDADIVADATDKQVALFAEGGTVLLVETEATTSPIQLTGGEWRLSDFAVHEPSNPPGDLAPYIDISGTARADMVGVATSTQRKALVADPTGDGGSFYAERCRFGGIVQTEKFLVDLDACTVTGDLIVTGPGSFFLRGGNVGGTILATGLENHLIGARAAQVYVEQGTAEIVGNTIESLDDEPVSAIELVDIDYAHVVANTTLRGPVSASDFVGLKIGAGCTGTIIAAFSSDGTTRLDDNGTGTNDLDNGGGGGGPGYTPPPESNLVTAAGGGSGNTGSAVIEFQGPGFYISSAGSDIEIDIVDQTILRILTEGRYAIELVIDTFSPGADATQASLVLTPDTARSANASFPAYAGGQYADPQVICTRYFQAGEELTAEVFMDGATFDALGGELHVERIS